MRIDAHQHYWKLSRGDYGWIVPELDVLYRDYLPEHLDEHLDRHRMDGTILVQAAATTAETEFMLELAERSDRILGVVGWLDLHDPHYVQQLAEFRKHPKFCGIRIMIQEMEDSAEVLQPDMLEAIRKLAALELPVDLLLRADQLPSTVALLREVPDLHAVIDHIAKPDIAGQKFEPWKHQMAEIAANPRIHCKLSGMVTEADHGKWRQEEFVPYVRYIADIFGPDRVMFGSDWPVCLLAASYDQVVDVLQSSLPEHWSEQESERLFGGNARTFYRIQNSPS